MDYIYKTKRTIKVKVLTSQTEPLCCH